MHFHQVTAAGSLPLLPRTFQAESRRKPFRSNLQTPRRHGEQWPVNKSAKACLTESVHKYEIATVLVDLAVEYRFSVRRDSEAAADTTCSGG